MKFMQAMGLESIQFQNKNFFEELTMVYEDLKKAGKDWDQEDHDVKLSKIVKHHTGLNVTFNFNENIGPCVEIPTVNKNSPLVNEFVKNFVSNDDGLKMVKNAAMVARGSVNLKTGKVTGVFCDVDSKIYIPNSLFIGRIFSAAEIAAMTLHEVGHLFTYYEFISRTVTTNQVLAGIARSLDKTDSIVEREAVLVAAKKALNLSDIDAEKLTKAKDRRVIEMVVITNVVKQSRSELGTDIYDANNWEQLADQYASRYGAGKELVTALQKLYSGNISMRNSAVYVAVEAAKLIYLMVSIIVSALAAPLGAYMFLFGLVWILVDGPGDPTYDRPGVRMRRIRNQLIEQLKDKKLPKSDVEEINKSIVMLDKMMEDVKDRLQLVSIFWGFFSKNQRSRLDAEELQQQLESLAANSLFASAAQLKHTA